METVITEAARALTDRDILGFFVVVLMVVCGFLYRAERQTAKEAAVVIADLQEKRLIEQAKAIQAVNTSQSLMEGMKASIDNLAASFLTRGR